MSLFVTLRGRISPIPNNSRRRPLSARVESSVWNSVLPRQTETKRAAEQRLTEQQPCCPSSQVKQLVRGLIVLRILPDEHYQTSETLLPQATILHVTKERWAQIGITTEFLIVGRTLGEFFRLRHVHGTNFSTAVAALYVGGALIAACSCWASVTFYFFRRHMLSSWITIRTVPVLLVYKICVIRW